MKHLVVITLLLMGCVPDPPFCKNDGHCQRVDGKGYCINGLCAECRDDSQCGETAICEQGACQAIPIATREETPPVAEATPECRDDAGCDGGERCVKGRCVVDSTPCDMSDLKPVYFDFDQHQIRVKEVPTLERHAACFLEDRRHVRITGHTDERGTEEYNLALGERRARRTHKFLLGLGVPEGQLSTDSRGEYDPVSPRARTEGEHQKNRRAELALRE